jgi:predicted phosphate transport protein (TIGR00153 family)
VGSKPAEFNGIHTIHASETLFLPKFFLMAFNSFLKFFTPKDRIFYSLFEEVADTVAKMGKLMKEVTSEPDFDKRAAKISLIEDQEHVNDELTHKIFTELGRNFITPFDREDIHYLASSLDDICDYIFASAKKINFYKVNPNDLGIQKMADLIEQASEQIKNAIKELRNMRDMRKITDALVKVNSIENQADDIFDMSIERLFETEPDAKEVIKKREIYQVMEIVTDKCEDAANVIESIIIKYA